jgi:glycosyltransferase involved in cell wall biosynthesis
LSQPKGIRPFQLHRAIEIAKEAAMPLRFAAKVDRADRRYFKRKIEPLPEGSAYALLFPIDWPEPFDLVMIGAVACGAPVIAYAGGSVAEVMDGGVTGFVVSDIDQALEAGGRVRDLSRARCREVFENRFTASRMASDYVNVYTRLACPRMRKVAQSLEWSLRACQSA